MVIHWSAYVVSSFSSSQNEEAITEIRKRREAGKGLKKSCSFNEDWRDGNILCAREGDLVDMEILKRNDRK